MKTPLHYQISEYDCGPTTLLNALNFLFEREEIPPDIIRNIMLYSLDCYSFEGIQGKHGTSRMAMMFLSSWLNNYGEMGRLNISNEYLTGENVFIGDTSRINDALNRGAAVIVRLFYEVEHYVLLTGIKASKVFMFDPYFNTDDFEGIEIELSSDTVYTYNRIVPAHFLNKEDDSLYALGKTDKREAVIVYNNKTKRSDYKTIEYFI